MFLYLLYNNTYISLLWLKQRTNCQICYFICACISLYLHRFTQAAGQSACELGAVSNCFITICIFILSCCEFYFVHIYLFNYTSIITVFYGLCVLFGVRRLRNIVLCSRPIQYVIYKKMRIRHKFNQYNICNLRLIISF